MSTTQHTIYSRPILIKLELPRKIFENYSNIIFRENPSSGSRVVPCGKTDVTKIIVTFRNFANAHKTTHRKAEAIWEDHGRDFWVCETGTDQQVAQFHDSYTMMMMMMMNIEIWF